VTLFGQKTKNHSSTHLNKEKMSAIQIAEKNKETIAKSLQRHSEQEAV
jgi:hypothetical protein